MTKEIQYCLKSQIFVTIPNTKQILNRSGDFDENLSNVLLRKGLNYRWSLGWVFFGSQDVDPVQSE